ncbi:MAG: transcriptional repressor [Thiothrix sp.]|nr:MAG: transcriptional repressor [Thiothrix sp.]
MKTDTEQTLAQKLIRQVNGRVTPIRLGVLELLLNTQTALSHQELEQAAAQTGLVADRVSLYRALDWLVEQGIAHRISSHDRAWRYKAQAELTSPHAHFQCKHCSQVFCLEDLQPALLFKLPPGYQLDEIELKLQGTCPACASLNAI